MLLAAGLLLAATTTSATAQEAAAEKAAAEETATMAHNPIIWADVPDVSVVRVGDTYYMSSTTMYFCPGVPVMKSKDLVNWEMASYCYDLLDPGSDRMNLVDGQNAYSQGTWASSIRERDGKVIVSTFANTTGKNHVFLTDDPSSGDWERIDYEPMMHDHSLFFDDDGRVWMIWEVGDILIRELKPDLSGPIDGSEKRVMIEDVGEVAGAGNAGLRGEGSQMIKVDGTYYLLNIAWPPGGMRTVIVSKSDSLEGPWESRVMLADAGIAQGCLVDTPDGEWYAMLFGDRGAVGRIPYLVPVTWEDGWPIFGIDGKVPMNLGIAAGEQGVSGVGFGENPIVQSDDFSRAEGDRDFPMAWQFNHQPDEHWSLTDREGWYRITTSRVDANVEQARNTITQRSFGPHSSATTLLDTSGMKPGDTAGMVALIAGYGYVGVEKTEAGQDLVMVRAERRQPVEVDRVPLEQETVHLKIEFDFADHVRTGDMTGPGQGGDTATFLYSTDNGETWSEIGEPVNLIYNLVHFSGVRFGLFNFATKEAGGHADFDDFILGGPDFNDADEFEPATPMTPEPQNEDATDKPAANAGNGNETFVLTHGAWAGGWEWKQVGDALDGMGHTVYRPTLTGQGERVHLASGDVDLDTHINDVVNLIKFEGLDDVVLMGHSYGGMVVTGVADRIPDRIKTLVYVDAAVPEDGETAFDAFGRPAPPEGAAFNPPGWPYPEDREPPYIVPHPMGTMRQPISLKNQARLTIPTYYLLTVDPGNEPEQDGFFRHYQRAKNYGWTVGIMEADHVPNINQPAALAKLLDAMPEQAKAAN